MRGAVLGEKYLVEMEIAVGGMGTVWVATDLQLGRRVAVKLMRSDTLESDSAHERFLSEARLIAQIQHPNVIQIFDYGVQDGAPYFVMELLHGEDLSAQLRQRPRRPPESLAALVTQTAKALAAAHVAGIVHRDLKPSNIYLTRVGGDETVKLLDFGVSVLRGSAPGAPGLIAGTPSYMSPEQIQDLPGLDHRSDLWSFAVILYRALTGEMPFRAQHYLDLVQHIVQRAHRPPSQIVPSLGEQVDRFFERALAKDPARRFQSATELAASFAALLAPEAPRAARLLFVDDEPDVPVLLKHRLRPHVRAGTYELLFASNGVQALEVLRENPDVAVVVTDINMPEMDGLTLLERVGQAHPLVGVIVLSAYNDMSNLRTAMNRGAFDFLVKPIDFPDLEATLQKTLRHVKDLRRTVQSIEENRILRGVVGSGVVDRLLPALRSVGTTPTEEAAAAVAFVSLHGFSPVPGTPPDVVTRDLNASLEIVVPEFLSRGATVERFLGAGLLAMHRGADCIEHLAEACVAAREKLWATSQRAGAGSPYQHSLSAGLGAGHVIVGSVGSPKLGRMDSLVLGSPLKVAAVLHAAAGPGQILLSEETFRPVACQFAGEVAATAVLPGETSPAPLYNLLHAIDAASGEPSVSGARFQTEPGSGARIQSVIEVEDPPTSSWSPAGDDDKTVALGRRRPG
jgi:serine/threonine protein kinase/class 3 adenylate cyclase